MARSSLLIIFLAVISFSFASGRDLHSSPASTFSDENPIREVTMDGLRELEASFIEVVGDNRHVLSFARFALRYGKKYETNEEIKKRFEIFKDNIREIESHNKKELSYTLGINEYTDMTWEEFSKQMLGAPLQYDSPTNETNLEFETNLLLPESRDWRLSHIVSPVKNQGSCGSCWAFSATGALEAAYAKNYGKQKLFSEQQLVDCAGKYGNLGCNGGLPSRAFKYIKNNGGLDTEDSYPYEAKDGVCKFSPKNVAVRVKDYFKIRQGDENIMRKVVGLIQPISVAFQVIKDFKQYNGGIYSNDACGKNPNHAVLIIGYGVENGIPYWIVKNSWGANWGLDGYFKMEMGKNMCGIALFPSFPTIE